MTPELESALRSLIVGSPLGAHMGMTLETVEPDRVRVRLPFRTEITTIGDLVHGGSIAALIDTAATAAAWSGVDPSATTRGTTIGFTVSFLRGVRGQDVVADARVIQRGRTIVVSDVAVTTADGTEVARALVTYKLG